MQIALARVRGVVSCTLADGGQAATLSASEQNSAPSELLEALEETAETGSGECYWKQAGGEYRWMFRREGETLRIAVLWSTGTLTGWEHVFWSECEFEPFARNVRSEVARVG